MLKNILLPPTMLFLIALLGTSQYDPLVDELCWQRQSLNDLTNTNKIRPARTLSEAIR